MIDPVAHFALIHHHATEKALREENERLKEALTNAMLGLDAHKAKINELTSTVCRLMTGAERYWEERWRDEAEETEVLKTQVRVYEKQIERLLKELEQANCPVQERWQGAPHE